MSVQYECPIKSISNSWPLDAATKGWLVSCSQGAGRGVSGPARDLSLSCSPGLVGVVGDGSGGSRGSDLGSFGSLDFGCLSARGSHATRVCPQFSSFPGFASPPFPQSLRFTGVHRSPFPQSLRVPGVHHSPFPQFHQLPRGSTTSPPNSMEPVASWVSCDGGRRSTALRPSPLGLGSYASGRPANATSSQWAIGHQRSTA